MSKRIIFFNVIYYAITIILILLGIYDPGASLGYGYFIIIFWILSAIILAFLLIKKIIYPRTLIEKVGVLTATPVLMIVFLVIAFSYKENVSSEYHFYINEYKYKQVIIDKDRSVGGRRIEYYKNVRKADSGNTAPVDAWIRDSTWIYLSETGDTVKRVKYQDGVEIK